jgi:hypothetical protein
MNGQYRMWVHAEDPNGNTASVAGASFTVTGGGEDATAPEVLAVSVSPGDIAPGQTVTITWRARDASGVDFTTAFVRSPTGAHVSGCGGNAAVRTSGTDLDGIYSQTCTLSVAAKAGTYTVLIQAIDSADNNGNGIVNATFTVTVPTTTTSTTTTTTTTTTLPTESTVPG